MIAQPHIDIKRSLDYHDTISFSPGDLVTCQDGRLQEARVSGMIEIHEDESFCYNENILSVSVHGPAIIVSVVPFTLWYNNREKRPGPMSPNLYPVYGVFPDRVGWTANVQVHHVQTPFERHFAIP